MVKNVSSKYSFSGWSLKTWFEKNKLLFLKNKETVKSLIMTIATYLCATYPDSTLVAILFGAGGAFASRLICDSIDFWLTENPQ